MLKFHVEWFRLKKGYKADGEEHSHVKISKTFCRFETLKCSNGSE
jgi:hypothetical protein